MSVGQRYIEGLQAKRSQTGELARTWQQMQAFQLQQQERERQKDEARAEALKGIVSDLSTRLGMNDEQVGRAYGALWGLEDKLGMPRTPQRDVPVEESRKWLAGIRQRAALKKNPAEAEREALLTGWLQEGLWTYGPQVLSRSLMGIKDDMILMGAGAGPAGEGKGAAQAKPATPAAEVAPAYKAVTLSPEDEALFQEWNAWQAQQRGVNPSTDPAVQQYDMRAYWAKYRPVVGEYGGGASIPPEHGGQVRFADEFKTVAHEGRPTTETGSLAGQGGGLYEIFKGIVGDSFGAADPMTAPQAQSYLDGVLIPGIKALASRPGNEKDVDTAVAGALDFAHEHQLPLTEATLRGMLKGERIPLKPSEMGALADVSWGDATEEQKRTIAQMYNLTVPEAEALMVLRTAGETKTAAEEAEKAQGTKDRATTIANLLKSPKPIDKRVAEIMRGSPAMKVDEAYSQADREATEGRQRAEFAESHALGERTEARLQAEAKKKPGEEGGYTVDQARVMNDLQQTEARLNGGVIYDEIRGVNVTVPKTEDPAERAMLETRARGLRKQGRDMGLSAEIVGQVGATANTDWGQDFGRLPQVARNWALEMRRQGKKSAWIKQGLLDKGYSW